MSKTTLKSQEEADNEAQNTTVQRSRVSKMLRVQSKLLRQVTQPTSSVRTMMTPHTFIKRKPRYKKNQNSSIRNIVNTIFYSFVVKWTWSEALPVF